MSLGFQTKLPKASSEIRFWKNFKFRFSETKPNLTFFPEGENQGQHREFYQNSENDRKKFQNPVSQFSSESEGTTNFQSLNSYRFALKKQTARSFRTNVSKFNSEWQIFFNELDDIPTKLNSVFPHEPNALSKS